MGAGFRPADSTIPLAGNLTAANGVDAKQPTRLLSLPEPKVLARVRELWHEDRKPADIVLVVDTSGSMGDEDKLAQAQQGLDRFLTQLSPRDRVALVAFNDQATLVRPLAEMQPSARQALQGSIDGLFAEGGTAVYDATLGALDLLQKQADPKHIAAEVVLTDGEDNKSSSNVDDVLEPAQGHLRGGRRARVHDRLRRRGEPRRAEAGGRCGRRQAVRRRSRQHRRRLHVDLVVLLILPAARLDA